MSSSIRFQEPESIENSILFESLFSNDIDIAHKYAFLYYILYK